MRKKDYYLSRKRSSNNEHQKSRFRRKRRRLEEGPWTDAIDANKSKFEKLPFHCLQRIWSFMTYEKMCEMRQVSKRLNEISEKALDEGQKELEKRLSRESEWVDKRILFPTNLRSSYDMLRFLKGLHEVISDSRKYYGQHVDYFVAGKLLDQANCLLKEFNSSTMVPYFSEHSCCDQKPHSLLGPIIVNSERAYEHFYLKILVKFVYYDGKAGFKRYKQNKLDIELQVKRNEMKILKLNLLKSRRQKIDCGNRMSEEFFILISKLNENVLDLTVRATTKVDERVINEKEHLNEAPNNFRFHLSAAPSSNLPHNKIAPKVMGVPAASKRSPNLATLPSSCIQNIVSKNLNGDKMAQLRSVCKSFNTACKKELNRKFEKVKGEFESQFKLKEQSEMPIPFNENTLKKDVLQEVCGLLQLCKDNYKFYLGTGYFFGAGKVLDEAECMYNKQLGPHQIFLPDFDRFNQYKPYDFLFRLMDLVNKAIAHFKFNVVPKYFPSTQNRVYVPDFLMTNAALNCEKERQLNLEEIEKLIENADVKIKELNDRNRKCLKVISGLKKKVFVLNKEVCDRIIALNEIK